MYIHDIESAWMRLEKAEHGREVALRDELIRQERLQQLAERFQRKVSDCFCCFFYLYDIPGPDCSKLTASLVYETLNFKR